MLRVTKLVPLEAFAIMARARIFRPARTAMQQGRAKIKSWVLEFEPARALRPDNLMGWAGGGDTRRHFAR
jgi:hypothetical protein